MKRPGRTPPLLDPRGQPLPDGIAEARYLRLGGIDQWVLVRGENVGNPALVFLHGGPGMSETGFFRTYCAPLEKHFTAVYWDQRGAGKSFDRGIPRSSMTVERFIADLDELVDAVRARVGCGKVVLFGHSWGSALGALYAARFPAKVAVYVGCGQLGDWEAGESAAYAWALAEAERRGDRRTAGKLRAIGPPPYTVDRLLAERTCIARLEGRFGLRAMWKTVRAAIGSPESSILDVRAGMRGLRFSLEAMWPEVTRLKLAEVAGQLAMPVFFFLGRHDHWVPPEMSVAYFESLKAPSKKVVWFEQSGHEPFADETVAFNEAMRELVTPPPPA
jgi:pimeloyl-ACP methyl ester carboxylesterase